MHVDDQKRAKQSLSEVEHNFYYLSSFSSTHLLPIQEQKTPFSYMNQLMLPTDVNFFEELKEQGSAVRTSFPVIEATSENNSFSCSIIRLK